jgi:hypothetical protein
VAERVDRVRDLTEERHPDEPAPQEALPTADRERNRQAEQHPDGRGAVDEHDERVLEQPLAIAISLCSGTAQDPAEVLVHEPVQRAVRIAFAVRECVVLSVMRRPLDRAALARHCPEDQQRRLHHRPGSEAAVAQHPVVPHRDAEAGGDVEADEERQLGCADQLAPEAPDREEGGENRHEDRDHDEDPIADPSHAGAPRRVCVREAGGD